MAKRIHMTQQQQYDYAPLRAGLGQITPAEFDLWQVTNAYIDEKHPFARRLCPKIYTTRTRPLQGEYIVVEGSRYKATPVAPEIRFRVKQSFPLSLIKTKGMNGSITYPPGWNNGRGGVGAWGGLNEYLNGMWYRFPELDLGVQGSTFNELREVLLKSYKKASLETPFYVSHLEPLGCAR